ncbi:MAG: inositol monophosphatase [Roseiflexaceae bacterium]|nr:inositol monophosphatase [Roseiflexaceae bacterium]
MNDIEIDAVRAWAVAAGQTALEYFGRVEARRKADHSFVTEADEAIERQIVSAITARHPNHGILGEEAASANLDREYVWVIDPIDGTASFVAGLGSWCVSIGLLRFGEPYLGVIYLPTLRDCYYAGPQGAAFLNDHTIQVISPDVWDDESWLATPASLHRRFDLDFDGKTRVLGSTAAQICYVARGSALGALLVDARSWDVAAGLTILRAAGGGIAPLDPRLASGETILTGQWVSAPLLVAAPTQIERLRSVVRVRP